MFFTQLTTMLGSQNLFASPYHPQSNGTAESTVHEGTGYAPFYLVYGRHPKFPLVNLGHQQLYEHYQSPSQSFIVDLQNRLNLAFEMVGNITKTTDYKDKENVYKIDDNVLLFN
ncbi:hypothetical protein G6F42_014341 [Rhizopus arrhizus]|nr:hypothetical protein G6F42_014341 [Rhizopus arrhizus]KAG1410156.1 hypothetical protein G6F58_009271 [Rhizopus delemar]